MAQSIIPPNKLKHALHTGRSVVGLMLVEFRQASVMQVFANAGFDFAIIDCEHGQFNLETIADVSRAGRQVGVTPIVRVPDVTYAHVTQPLDAGAQGIMIPRITDAQLVIDAVQMMKYPPQGKRGSVVARGHTDLKSGPVAPAMESANEESLLIVQIETRQALEHLDDILSVKGVDVAFVGPTDLSVSLGVAGKMTDPGLVAAIEGVITACSRHGVVPAVQMNDLELAAVWAGKGMKMISYSSEVGILTAGGAHAYGVIRKSFANSEVTAERSSSL